MKRNPKDRKTADAVGHWRYKAGRRYPPDHVRYGIVVYLNAMRAEAMQRVDRLLKRVNGPEGHMWQRELDYWTHILTHINTRLQVGTASINDRLYQQACLSACVIPTSIDNLTPES